MLKVGMIGMGRMGNHHGQKLNGIDDVEITATCTSPVQNVPLLNQQEPKLYHDCDDMLENEELDIVYICTPTMSHAEIAKKIIDKRLNLFLEKPLTMNLIDAWDLVTRVKQTDIICTIGYMYRYRNIVNKMEKMFNNKPISLLNGYWYWTVPPVSHIKDKDIGGGPVVDQLTHIIDLCRLFAGEVKSVNARYTLNTRKNESFNNWDGYVLNLEFESGAVASLSGTLSLFEALGEQSMLDNVVLDVFAKDLFGRFTPSKLTMYTDGKMDIFEDYTGEINDEFIKACRENNADLIKSPIEEAMKTLAVTLAANASNETGETIVMDDFYKKELGFNPFTSEVAKS
ncbi:Gfo/Idh/MocA family protein [Virgibacillus indicus]|uniref:Gfo/Idh/MocA family protein n=1 Tax=Virgibacillus indicus TaxID=2024554 RepID=UPI0013FDC0B8|nr:Gfo/Idh/MocA family oxidoreductase [Virgibacillus indicus]